MLRAAAVERRVRGQGQEVTQLPSTHARKPETHKSKLPGPDLLCEITGAHREPEYLDGETK